MTAIKPSAATPSTDIPRRSRANPHSSPILINQQQRSTSSPSPPISSFSPPPSPSALPIALTHPHDTTTTTTNDNDTTTTSQAPSTNTRRSYNDTHHHRPHHVAKQDHRGRPFKNNINQIHTYPSTHHRHNHPHRSTSIASSNNNSNSNSSYSRRTHVRCHSASAYYAGPADHDRVIRTANAHAQAAASGILSPRLRNSRLLLSPKGQQPQRHLLRQQRQQQQQQRRYQQQQQLLRPLLFGLPHQLHHQQQEQEKQEQEHEEQEQHHTSRRGSLYSILLPSISPSSSVSVVPPLVLQRSSSMPLVHTRPLERQDQEESAAAASTLRRTQPFPLQPPFYRLLQQSPQSRRQQQQQRHQNLESESDHDQDKPFNESPPDPRLISQKLLQWQEHQEHKKRQEEQRQMQAFRIKKFSDSNTDLDYRPLVTSVFKEGFQEHWGDPIVEHQREEGWEEEDGQQQNPRRSNIQQDDRDIDVTGSSHEPNSNNLWKEQRQRQQQLAQEQDMMETDSVMETDKIDDCDDEGDGDEEMDPYTRLQRARKAKEDAMKDYQKAGRNLQRAQEREEAIMFEYETELIEVEVGSSVSQQHHRHRRHGHELEHHQQCLSSPLAQHQQRQQQMEERERNSSPTTTAAAAAAAATFQAQDDNNNEAMANSQIVPQVGDTPSVMSETPHAVIAPMPLLPVSTRSESVPRRALSPMVTITTTAENQVPNQTRSGSQDRSRSQSVANNELQLPPISPHLRHHFSSPRVKIESEELDEPFFKKHTLDGGGGVIGSDDVSKSRRGPKYKDYDVTIVIPSSIGSSDIGMSGQPESSNAQERREQAGKQERRLPDKWRSPTPMPRSMHARREATRRPQEMSWESTRPPLRFGPGGPKTAKVLPVDLFGGRGGSSQQQQPRQQHYRQHGSSSFRPVLLSPRSSVPRPRPYPPPSVSQTRRASQVQSQVPVGVGLPLNFFTQGMPMRPAQPSSSLSSSHQQQQGQDQGQGQSSPLMAPPINQAASAASAFTGPAAPTPRYINAHRHPHPQGPSTWRLPEFMDENGHPYPTVVFYTHIDRVDHFYHQHYPATSTTSTASRSRDVSVSPRSAQTSPNFFARRSGGGGERMEDVRDGGGEGYEDMAIDGEYHHQQQQRQGRSRTTSRQADRDERQEDRRERKPRAKSESFQF